MAQSNQKTRRKAEASMSDDKWEDTANDPGYMAEMPDQAEQDAEVVIRRSARSLAETRPALPTEEIFDAAPDPEREPELALPFPDGVAQATAGRFAAGPREVPTINVEQETAEWSELAELAEQTPPPAAAPPSPRAGKPSLTDLVLPTLSTRQTSVPQLQSLRVDLPPRTAANTRPLSDNIMKKLEKFRQVRMGGMHRKDRIADLPSENPTAKPQEKIWDASPPPAPRDAAAGPAPTAPPLDMEQEEVQLDFAEAPRPEAASMPTPAIQSAIQPVIQPAAPVEKIARPSRQPVLDDTPPAATAVQPGPQRHMERQTPPAAQTAPQVRLVAENLGKQIRKHPILRGVSLELKTGEAVGLLGPNGAGKTTCFYIMTGLISADFGSITLGNVDITHLPMYRRARLGIGYLPQEASIFRGMNVEDNIRAVLEVVEPDRSTREAMLDDLLAEFSITHLRQASALSLSGGERRRVEIARALASQPRFILLDEPFAGIDPIAVADIRDLVSHLKDRGLGVLITDHNVRETLDIVDRAYILHSGTVLMEGTPQEIVSHADVRRVYLGEHFNL